jgi:hypothetical protein
MATLYGRYPIVLITYHPRTGLFSYKRESFILQAIIYYINVKKGTFLLGVCGRPNWEHSFAAMMQALLCNSTRHKPGSMIPWMALIAPDIMAGEDREQAIS